MKQIVEITDELTFKNQIKKEGQNVPEVMTSLLEDLLLTKNHWDMGKRGST